MDFLEREFGVALGAYHNIEVFGFDLTKPDKPLVQYAHTVSGERHYSKMGLVEFKKHFGQVA